LKKDRKEKGLESSSIASSNFFRTIKKGTPNASIILED
jgi:hypothetical protein